MSVHMYIKSKKNIKNLLNSHQVFYNARILIIKKAH